MTTYIVSLYRIEPLATNTRTAAIEDSIYRTHQATQQFLKECKEAGISVDIESELGAIGTVIIEADEKDFSSLEGLPSVAAISENQPIQLIDPVECDTLKE